ncbi:MAG: hypothetical protein HY719_02105 [Planctomycetes bacterium]|nr:hypothetical protein [Planctomycetota bacterium]
MISRRSSSLVRGVALLAAALGFAGGSPASRLGAAEKETLLVELHTAAPQVRHALKAVEQAARDAGATLLVREPGAAAPPPTEAPARSGGKGAGGRAVTARIVVAAPRAEEEPNPRAEVAEALGEEVYAFRKAGGKGGEAAVVLVSGDAVGAMYGLSEAAEALFAQRSPRAAVSGLAGVSRAPFLSFRAVNMFLHMEALWDEKSWFYREEFWTAYLDMLSRARINVLDVHGGFGLAKTDFPNLYPYFVKVPGFDDVGVSAERAEKNLAMLNRVIDLAEERGVKVALMNYNAGAHHGELGAEGKPAPPAEPLPGEEVTAYTREAARLLVESCPKLWTFGFRIGESGQPENFFQQTYVAALSAVDRGINVYTRSWAANRARVKALTEGYHRGKFFIEVKYNGEQMCMPWQCITSPAQFIPSYSYEDYTDQPRGWEVVYQIRANGTHRLFHWGPPSFIKRAVETCRLGGGVGFSIEPFEAYAPMDNGFVNEAFRWFDWRPMRHWYWYEMWGRLGYDPTLPPSHWERRFDQQVLAGWGRPVVEMLDRAGWAVPLIATYHCLGPDHREMAPELETGNDRVWVHLPEDRVHGDIDTFARVRPLDTHAMISIWDSARRAPNRGADGRYAPEQFAGDLRQYAAAADRFLARWTKGQPALEKAPEPARKALASFAADAEAVRALARYFVAKSEAALSYSHWKAFGWYGDLQAARQQVEVAAKEWAALAAAAEKQHPPFRENLRTRYPDGYTWTKEGALLQNDRHRIAEEMLAASEQVERAPVAILGHRPRFRADASAKMRLGVSALYHRKRPRPAMAIYYRFAPATPWEKKEMPERGAGAFEADIQVAPGRIEYYFEARRGERAVTLPENGAEAPFATFITDDRGAPEVVGEVSCDKSAGRTRIGIAVRDASGLKSVTMHYKPIASTTYWRRAEMAPAAAADAKGARTYSADLPLDVSQGALLSFSVVDEFGNGRCWPDFHDRTPYIVLEPPPAPSRE